MNKKIISRLEELIKEVESLPKDIYTESEFDSYSDASEEDKGKITKLQSDRHSEKDIIYRKILAFFNAHIPDKTEYFTQLSSLTFRPKEGLYNSFHYRNSEEWKKDRKGLINLLDLLKTEFEESTYAVKKSDSIFNSRLFWAILSLVGTTAYFLGTYITTLQNSETEKLLEQTELNNEELNRRNQGLKDSLNILNTERTLKAEEKTLPNKGYK